MRKFFLFFIFFALVVFEAFPLGVDVNEIKTGKKIEFINYTGPSKQFTVAEIKAWGNAMAADIQKGAKESRFENQFILIHAIDPQEKNKLDADIFSLTTGCTVRHIDTIRLVLSGYLETQYKYNTGDSNTLAIFATYYNALYRGDLTYFGQKYKKIVMDNLSARDAGISTTYKEWAGATKLLIPLSENAKPGDLSALDTSMLTNEKVIDSMRKESDKKIKEREDMVDLRQREVKEDKKTVEKDKAEVEKKKTEVEKDKTTIAKEKETVEKAKEDLVKTKEEAKKITDEKAKADKEKEIAVKEKEIAVKENEIAAKEKETTEKVKATEITDKKVKEKETVITKKETEIAKEKENIDKDKFVTEVKKNPEKKAEELYTKEKELAKREDDLKNKEAGDKKVYAGKFYYLRIKDYLTGGHYNNELFILDAPTGELVTSAKNLNICGHRYDIWSGGVVVVTHTGNHAGHYLTLLDLNSLEQITQGKTTVFHRSFVEIKDNSIYAVVVEKDKYYLGKFDTKLNLISKTKDEIDPDTFISYYKDKVFVNNTQKKILVLNNNSFSTENVLNP